MESQILVKHTFFISDATADAKNSQKRAHWFLTLQSLHSNDVFLLSKICQWLPTANGIKCNFFTLCNSDWDLNPQSFQ